MTTTTNTFNAIDILEEEIAAVRADIEKIRASESFGKDLHLLRSSLANLLRTHAEVMAQLLAIDAMQRSRRYDVPQ